MSLVRDWTHHFKWLLRSSTLRLTALLSLIFALGFVVAIFVALTLGQRAIERRMDGTLATIAQGVEVEDEGVTSAEVILRPLENLSALPEPFRRAVARGGGTVDLDDDLMGSDIWRVMVSQDSDDEPIMVAVPLEDSSEVQDLLAGILWTTAGIVIFATLGIGAWAGFLAQRRLKRITTTLGHLAAGDLTARTGHRRLRDDLDDIAQNLDQTAADIERLVTQTRNLSASIAHDLRTPLARLHAQLEMLPEGEERAAALEEADRLAGIFDTIMRVARIEAGQGRDGFEQIALEALLGDLAETFGPVVEDAGKSLALDISDAAMVLGDRGMLVQALANLIQNSIIHGGDQITLFAHGRAFGVCDNGVGVDPQQFDEILKPMARLDAARSTQGSGLGLALVRAVSDRHGAALEVSANEPSGLRVAMRFTEL